MNGVYRIALLTGAACAALGSGQAFAQTEPQGARDIRMADIIVTAQRREERNQDVPIAITALTGQRLQQQGIAKEQDLQASVPSLVVGPNGQNRTTQSFTIRGQGSTFQGSPGVVVYMNEVPLPAGVAQSSQGGPGNFLDLENLQVLSGPQGTLFGRNTTGGAVLLVPKKPTNDFAGYVQGKYGNYNNTEIEGAINVPVVDDKLMVRVAGAYRDRDGFTKDVVWNKTRDDIHYYTGRIGVLFKPTERIENYFMGYYSNSRTNGSGIAHAKYNIPFFSAIGLCAAAPISVAGNYSCDIYEATNQQSAALGPRKVAHSVDDFTRQKIWGVSNALNIELNDNLTLRNIMSYQRLKYSFSDDSDGSVLQQGDLDAYDLPAPGVVTMPGSGTPIVYNNESPYKFARDSYSYLTAELQLQGSFLDNHLTFTTGGFFYHQDPKGFQGASSIFFCPAVSTGSATACRAGINGGYVDTKSKALYFQSTFDFGAVAPALESLRLTGGFRYTWDTLKGLERAGNPTGTGGFTCFFDGSLQTSLEGCDANATLKSKAPTWTVGLDYKPVKNLMLYGKVSRGYKAGLFNPFAVRAETLTVKPEYLTAYEVGFKSDFRIAGAPARFNANYYYMEYRDLQRSVGDVNFATGGQGAAFISADAHIKGVEAEASIRPWEPLEIGGNFSWTQFRYKEYNLTNFGLPSADCSGALIPFGGVKDLSCIKGAYVAPYIWSIHVAADVPIAEDMGNLSLYVSYSHTAPQHTQTGDLNEPSFGEKLPAFGTLNASLDWNNVMQSGFDAGVFVTNAANKLYRIGGNTSVYTTQGFTSFLYGEPRMYGLKLRYRFGGG